MNLQLLNYQTCPPAVDFEAYLKQTGTDDFKTAFESHLSVCSLCTEAVEGYKVAGIYDVTGFSAKTSRIFEKQHRRRLIRIVPWSIAASIAVLLSVGSFYFLGHKSNNQHSQQLLPGNELYAPETVHGNGPKRLVKTLNEQYWYLGQNKAIAVNDVFISPGCIEMAMRNNEPVQAIIVEIKNKDFDYSNQIINQLKSTQKAPVFTF